MCFQNLASQQRQEELKSSSLTRLSEKAPFLFKLPQRPVLSLHRPGGNLTKTSTVSKATRDMETQTENERSCPNCRLLRLGGGREVPTVSIVKVNRGFALYQWKIPDSIYRYLRFSAYLRKSAIFFSAKISALFQLLENKAPLFFFLSQFSMTLNIRSRERHPPPSSPSKKKWHQNFPASEESEKS